MKTVLSTRQIAVPDGGVLWLSMLPLMLLPNVVKE